MFSESLSDAAMHQERMQQLVPLGPGDRRVHQRFVLRVSAELKLGAVPVCEIQVVDFSFGGLRVAGDWRLLDAETLIVSVARDHDSIQRFRASAVRYGRGVVGIQLLDLLRHKDQAEGSFVLELDLANTLMSA